MPSVGLTFRRVAKTAEIDTKGISGHSCQVGAAQDLMAEGYDLSTIMHAGRWQSDRSQHGIHGIWQLAVAGWLSWLSNKGGNSLPHPDPHMIVGKHLTRIFHKLKNHDVV